MTRTRSRMTIFAALWLAQAIPAFGIVVNQEINCRSSALLSMDLNDYPPEQRAALRGLSIPASFQDAYELTVISTCGWRTDIKRGYQESFTALLFQVRKDETVLVGKYVVYPDPGSPDAAKPQGGYYTTNPDKNAPKRFQTDPTFELNFTAPLLSGTRAGDLTAEFRDDQGKIVKVSNLKISCVGLRN